MDLLLGKMLISKYIMDVIGMVFSYKGSVCSDLDLIKNFVDNILNKLDSVVDNKETIFDIRLIMNELVINGVFHGNQCINNKQVDLGVDILDNKIIIRVKDEGTGIDFDFSTYNPLELRCSGRGLVLVHEIGRASCRERV